MVQRSDDLGSQEATFSQLSQEPRSPFSRRLMRHADIRTTMNIYGDVVTDEMAQAAQKVAALELNGRETAGTVAN